MKREPTGILPLNKPKGRTSFSLVAAARRAYGVQKVGHAGTLDPFATGVMILLIGKSCTRLSDRFLLTNKEYIATLKLGIRTDSYDVDGATLSTSDFQPDLPQILQVLEQFQGEISQIPPMFSAKKVQGKKLYHLARQGISIERQPQKVSVSIKFLHYEYPFLSIQVSCSKGTYIRSLAEDIGNALTCGAHLCDLSRTRSGPFTLQDCVQGELLSDPDSLDQIKLLAPEDIPFLNPTKR